MLVVDDLPLALIFLLFYNSLLVEITNKNGCDCIVIYIYIYIGMAVGTGKRRTKDVRLLLSKLV